MKPLVSVIIPTHNVENYIGNTILSVKDQTFDDWEAIIIDDASTDETIKAVRKAIDGDPRFKVLIFDQNRGVALARNKGIEEAKGRFIAFLDGDDVWHKKKLEKHINFMLETKAFFSFTSYNIIENSTIVKTIHAPKVLTYKMELLYNRIGTSTVIYDTEKIGKVFMPSLRKRQDYATWLYILKNFGPGHGLDEALTDYMVRAESISRSKLGLIKYNWKVYREYEKLDILRSSFYLLSDIVVKLLGIK